LEHVQKALNREGVSDKMVSVVHAANLDLRRGYAFNVGAEYAIDVLGCQGVGLVDDDDILLPAFAQMARLLPGNHSAIISGRSLAKSEDGELTEMHKPLFAACLSNENYIPTNAFVVNEVAISLVKRKYGSLFSEEMHYLEDWWFFIAALDAGVQFSVFDEVVGEFRMGSDGNSDIRKYPFEFERCRSKTEQFASTVRRRHGLSLNLRQGNIAQKFAKQLSEVQRTKLLSALKIGKKS
jgi:glycosyltransferase involved in cell wall biosynthesis